MRYNLPGLVSVALAVLTAGCVDKPDPLSPPSKAVIVGTWVMRTMNGVPLPYTMNGFEGAVTLNADTLFINGDGTWREVAVAVGSFGWPPVRTGIYTASSTEVTFEPTPPQTDEYPPVAQFRGERMLKMDFLTLVTYEKR